jgi:hypothetical protein
MKSQWFDKSDFDKYVDHSKKSDEEIIKFISSYMPSFIREEK